MSEIKVNSIKGVGASTAAITVNNSDGTCTANITNNLSNRNVIVNGGCLVAQRGTSSTSNGYGSVDRMKMSVSNTDELAFAQKQTSDGPDGFKKCFEFDVTTAESALAADELVYLKYLVEAQDLVPFYNANGTGKNFTLSFYVKAHQAGTYQVGIYKADNTVRFITKTYTIASSGVWQRVELNFTGDTGTSGIDADNDTGFQIHWVLGAGTNFTSGTPQTTWGSYGNTLFAAGQAVNVLSSTDNYWRITGIQLELDSGSGKATDFEHRSFAQELALCQRYYQTIGVGFITACRGASSSQLLYSYTPPVNMRASPTISTTATGFHSSFGVRSYRDGSGTSDSTTTPATVSLYWQEINPTIHLTQTGFSVTDDRSAVIFVNGGAITLSAEL